MAAAQSRSLFARIPHHTFFSYRYPASRSQFQRILLPRRSQNPNPAPFFSEVPDPKNILPDPVCYVIHVAVVAMKQRDFD